MASARDILDERLARGEITADEHAKLTAQISQTRPRIGKHRVRTARPGSAVRPARHGKDPVERARHRRRARMDRPDEQRRGRAHRLVRAAGQPARLLSDQRGQLADGLYLLCARPRRRRIERFHAFPAQILRRNTAPVGRSRRNSQHRS